MSCPVCQRAVAGSCSEGFIKYLSGDYPCPFNPDKDWIGVRNPRTVAPLSRAGRLPVNPASEVRNNPEREDDEEKDDEQEA